MENGNSNGFSASDAVLWGAMNNMGRGYGGGAWGGGYGGYGPFAGASSNAVRINRNADLTRLALDRTSDQAEETRRIIQNEVNAFRSDINNNRTNDRLVDSEFRQTDRLRDIQSSVDKCCCDIRTEMQSGFAGVKLQQCEDTAKLMAEIKAVETRTIERDLNRAERQLQTQTIISTCGCGCGGGVRPCPPPQ